MHHEHAILLTCIGCDSGPSVAPERAADGPFAELGAHAASKHHITPSTIYQFGSMKPVGSAELRRNTNGISITMKADLDEIEGDLRGHTMTAWGVWFNHPAGCFTPYQCTAADLFNEAAGAGVNRVTGRVFGQAGQQVLAGNLRGGTEPFGILGTAPFDPTTAEVHVLGRSHYLPIAGQVREQLHQPFGGCAVENAAGEAPTAVGECADMFFSVHPLP